MLTEEILIHTNIFLIHLFTNRNMSAITAKTFTISSSLCNRGDDLRQCRGLVASLSRERSHCRWNESAFYCLWYVSSPLDSD